jgi:CheY-like chemotaxis protein
MTRSGETPEVVITDLRMPGMTPGTEVAARIKELSPSDRA